MRVIARIDGWLLVQMRESEENNHKVGLKR